MSEESREEGQREPNIKLYIVVACIAALVLVAVMQVNITNILLSALMIFSKGSRSNYRLLKTYEGSVFHRNLEIKKCRY